MTNADWEILIIQHGQRKTWKSDAFLNHEWYGEPDIEYMVGYYFWIVRNADTTIIVDTGYSQASAAARNREVIIDPILALECLGVSTSPDMLVITHAHYDHIGNIDRLTPLRTFISRKEYEFWTGPLAKKPLFSYFAEPQEVAELARLHDAGLLELIDDAVQIASGVRMIPVGGHTPGQTILEVETRAGTILLASDAGHFHEEIERDMLFKSMTDWPKSYEVLQQIREGHYAAVISGHDIDELNRYPRIQGELGAFVSRVGGTS